MKKVANKKEKPAEKKVEMTAKTISKIELKTKKEINIIKKSNVGADIANYYGFIEKETPEIVRDDITASKSLVEGDYIDPEIDGKSHRLPLHVEEKVALIRAYNKSEWDKAPQPVMLYLKDGFKNPFSKNHDNSGKFCDLEIMGSDKSISEALLIHTASVMLNEAGYNNLGVEINSMGDKESLHSFYKDLVAHYRKHINDMDDDCRQMFKKDPFELLSHKCSAIKDINCSAPRSMDYLSEKSRNHFREVLEYLENIKIPYKINDHLVGNRKYCTETIYEIVNYDSKWKKEKTLAIGVRYDGLNKKLGYKRDISCAGISVLLKKNEQDALRKDTKRNIRPLASFVQLGFEAKLISLNILEDLRKAKILVYQTLSRDKLMSQISLAEKSRIPFTIIIGKKEAVE
ncbi:MAG: hypothetical protein Q7R78_03035, partial [bacterium]|nr:hypothetical protein [bacterium]